MAHQEVPEGIVNQTILLGKINKKVVDDGTTSVLKAMLLKNGIVLADDIGKGVIALEKNDSYLSFKASSEVSSQKRNILMLPINKDMSSCYQFLKIHFSPEFKIVADWGATIGNGGKITYATTTLGQQTMLLALVTKNGSYEDPEVSPLADYLTLHHINLAQDAIDAAEALDLDTIFADDKKSSETAREQRDIEWAIPLSHIRLIGDYLMKLYKGNTKILGEYGFVVVNTAKVIKTRNQKLSPGDTRFKIRVTIGSTILNTGTIAPIYIYTGATISGTPTILAPGKIYTITKGNSVISIANPSETITMTYSLIPKKLS
jgi:hypothetical protein